MATHASSQPLRRRLPAAERRVAIVDAARRVFARSGFHGAATLEIAREAGCSEPTLYKHFPSKQALFAAVLEEGKATMHRRIAEEMEREDDPFVAFSRCVTRMVDDPLFLELMRVRAMALALIDEPEIRDAVQRSMAAFRARLATTIRAGQERGSVRRDVDADHAVLLFLGLSLAAGCVQAVGGQDELRRARPAAQALVDLLTPEPSKEDRP